MRPVSIRMSAAGRSSWIPLNYLQNNFNVSAAVVLSASVGLTFTVQHTYDDIFSYTNRKITRSTTTATVNYPAHGLSNGDWAAIQGTGSTNLDGFQVVTVVDADNFSYTVSNSGTTAAQGQVAIARVFSHATITGTASISGTYTSPVIACRLYVSAYTSGTADLLVLQGLGT